MINDQKLKPIIGFADLHKIELNQDQVFLEKELKQEKNYSRMKFKQYLHSIFFNYFHYRILYYTYIPFYWFVYFLLIKLKIKKIKK